MKKHSIYILALCLSLLCAFGACGRDRNNSNNNSATNPSQKQTTMPTPTTVPTVVPNNTMTPDNAGTGVIDGIEDVGDGIINGTEDVIDGVGNAVDDIGNGITGDDINNNDAMHNGTTDGTGAAR